MKDSERGKRSHTVDLRIPMWPAFAVLVLLWAVIEEGFTARESLFQPFHSLPAVGAGLEGVQGEEG